MLSLRRTKANRRKAGWLAAPLAVVALALAGCGTGAEPGQDAGSGGSATGSFEPVTIPHAFGETVIDEQPERVATWGWGTADAAIALDTIPVAIPKLSYGATEEGLMPWTAEALEAAGAETPALLAETEEPPFEEIAAANPDVILAQYSGITEADYEKLTQIAPTVAYPDQPWATPWREVIETTGTALGKSAEAKELLAEIDRTVAQAAEEHPEFEGRTIAAVAADPSAFYVYKAADPRVQFLEDLGFTVAPSVKELATDESTFFYTLSLERVDQLTSDVLASYSPTEQQAQQVANRPALQAMPQFQQGTVAPITGEALVSSVSPPTALSLTWGLDEFVASLSQAVEQVEPAA